MAQSSVLKINHISMVTLKLVKDAPKILSGITKPMSV
jgi:hypothetical protein